MPSSPALHRARGPAAARAPVEYTGIQAVEGPLVVVEGVEGVGWDEHVEIVLPGGEVRQGVVLEVSGGLAVVQVFQGTEGLRRRGARVRFTGGPARIPVGEGWLGRTCNGRGDPVDGGPPIVGRELRGVAGLPVNPARRETPHEAVLTGISVIDALTTLVRGQKLPVFSIGGLPHLELAAQVASQARVEGGSFRIVFAAMGVTHADAALVRAILERRAGEGDLALIVNTADDPVVERILTPRIALTVAEHLAFDLGQHVLVVMADMTSYCEAVREVAAARGEVPGRRGYPGYLYSDLASLYERCGRLSGRPGSLTQVPVLTMPAGDITHPVPDLTGYITEGQLVLGPEPWARGVYPPFDPLSSLSRLMRLGSGPGRTREDHPEVASQLYAALARARQVRELAELVGSAELSDVDRAYLRCAEAFETRLVAQGQDEDRSLERTLELAWEILTLLPRSELTRIRPELVGRHLGPPSGAGGPAPGGG
ncbi:MAG TPA: V-type ATP synthase subunit B [Candidatus Eisenbacteria bacterium]|nr:V-type ATP synthase subunit B [Candidatus Eisenbacteria bacterium]